MLPNFSESEQVSTERRQELLEGPVRGVKLYSDGYIVLHGSCVCIGATALSIVGPAGAGKSTLATMLCQRGAKLVSDGMTPVEPLTLEVAPGPPRTKLNDESLRLLGQVPEQFALVHSESQKRYFPVPGIVAPEQEAAVVSLGNTAEAESCDRSEEIDLEVTNAAFVSQGKVRLRTILIVEDAESTKILAIPGAASLIKLIANVYLASYLPPDHSPILMQRAAALIQRCVQVKALRRAKKPGRLLEIVEAIEREVGNT